MSNFHRRDFLTGAAAVAAGVAAAQIGTNAVNAGDPTFMNNVPDPLLTARDLPTFKFALEASRGREENGSSAKEATVTQLPISKGMSGVTMRLALVPCAKCTGTPPLRSGPTSFPAGCAPRPSTPAGTLRRMTTIRAISGISRAGMATCWNALAISRAISS